MLICEICGEELPLEEDMRTHLLLSHFENQMSCPLCSLSGVSYDELDIHVSSAHPELRERGESVCGSPTPSTGRPSSSPPPGTRLRHRRDGPKPGTHSSSRSPGDNSRTTVNGVSSGTSSVSTTGASRLLQEGSGVTIPPPTGPTASGGPSLSSGGTAPVGSTSSSSSSSSSSSAGTAGRSSRTTQGSVKHCDQDEDDGRSASEEEASRVKQKRLSSPRKERQFSCPMCALVCSDCFILQEHVELHLLEHNTAEGAVLGPAGTCSPTKASPSSNTASGGRGLECPMCSVVCVDSVSLQDHVELHLDCEAAARWPESPGSDLRLARQLQEEEEQRRREEEARREALEFKKLQKQFGVEEGGGGYRRQAERKLEREVSRGVMAPADYHARRADMMETLASGLDDGRTRTQGVMEALYEHYQRESREGVQAWLCCETDHYSSSEGDRGWGCGYRNLQMLLSALHRAEAFTGCLTGAEGAVPSVPRVQGMIEQAWREGLDPQGASHFNQRLQGTRAWIGATEIYALLTSIGVSARILDFHQPSGPGDTHPRLFEWVKQYFSQAASRGARLPPRVVQTARPPLYLQHQGHSRSIVGVEQKRNGALCLLLLDPGCSPADARKLLTREGANAAVRRLRKFPGNLKHKQYQVVAAVAVLSPEERQTRILNSRTLRAERIP